MIMVMMVMFSIIIVIITGSREHDVIGLNRVTFVETSSHLRFENQSSRIIIVIVIDDS